jgi:sporulation protein YlmC with PRC-barrel domain
MDIPINAKVNCTDGTCGQVTQVILKPTTEMITHLVVTSGLFPETKYMISIDHVAESTPHKIRLDCSLEAVSKMPVFDQVQFIPSDLNGFIGSPFMMWPYYPPQGPYIRLEKDHIPAHELAIRRGAGIEATDGHVGRVDEFLINPENDHITHLVLGQKAYLHSCQPD